MIDTHCHIDLYKDPFKIAHDCENMGIKTIAVTNLPSYFEIGYPHLLGFKHVKLALGLHPSLAERHKSERHKLKLMITKTDYIGEIGLDFSKSCKHTKEIQLEILRFIFNIIKDKSSFISLHSRGAESNILELLEEFTIKKAVFHWYSGSFTILDQIIKSGHYFSINTEMVKSKKGKALIEKIPLARILTETDGPYIQINNQPAKPTDVKLIYTELKDIWHLTTEEIERQIDANFNTLISQLNL